MAVRTSSNETSRARWEVARRLFRAVVDMLDRRIPATGDNVLVMGPAGRSKIIPRAVAESMARAGRLSSAPSLDAAREALDLPPAITITDDSDRVMHGGAQ